MKFWDSSAIIPLCVDEAPTSGLKRLAQEDNGLVVWWATPLECYAALARRRREEGLNRVQEQQAQHVLSLLLQEWTELHPLRAGDSLQLAAALVWARGQALGQSFVCLDQRLKEAAQREGFTVFPQDA